MKNQDYQQVVEATRGNIVESIQYGAATIVDADGRLYASYGNPDVVTFMRSSSKPLQLLPMIERGGAEAFHLTDKEIAIMCASHAATEEHVSTVEGIQKKIDVKESDLMCGVHYPQDENARQKMIDAGEQPNQNHNNCSGKHTGMLAHARLRDFSLEDYINPSHPVQKTIIETFSEMCDMQSEQVELGVDGCSVPVFAVPLRNAALGFARLCNPKNLTSQRAEACRRITHAMYSHPYMVAGQGKFDSHLMEAAGGKLVAKSGAEGYLSIGIMPGVLSPDSPALGIAIKIADGDLTGRARPVTALEILCQLCLLTEEELQSLAQFDARPVTNWRGVAVGELRATFALQNNAFSG